MLVQGTVTRLMEIKEDVSSTTWFKDHTAVFTDPGQLGTRNIETEQDNFLRNIYRPYIQSVVDHISSRLRSSDIVSSFSVFDPSNLPDSEDTLSSYGLEKISVLTDFHGTQQHVKFGDEVGQYQRTQKQSGKYLGESCLQTSKKNPHKLSYIVF